MKIAIFSDLYTPAGSGGIVTSVRAQKAELEKLGHEVTVFCPGFETREKNVFLVPSHPKIRINGAVIAMRPPVVEEYILQNYPNFSDFDVVHVQYEASCSIAGVKLAQRFKIPLVQTIHGREDMAITYNVPHPFKWLVARILDTAHQHYLSHTIKVKRDKFQAPTFTRARMWEIMVNQAEQADVVAAPAEHLIKKLEHYGVTRPTMVLPNGIPEDLVEEKYAEHTMQDGDVLKIIWSSRLSHEKRFLPFLEAVAQLKRPYMLYVYGEGNDYKRGQRFARRHKMKAKFYGQQPRSKIVARMMETHLFVLTSYNFDVQPMTILEAEMMGVPVFLCDPTMLEVAPAGGYVLADAADATSMAMALDRMPAENVAKMSKAMLKNRKQAFQSEQVRTLLKVYKMAMQVRQENKR